MNEGEKSASFLTKKLGGLPVWAWGLIVVGGVVAGYLLIKWQQSKGTSALTTGSSPDLTTGNASGNETNPATGTVGSNGVIDNPFPESNVNGQQIPIVPPGYQAVYDPNGNIVGWAPIASNPTPSEPTKVPSEPGPPHVPFVPLTSRATLPTASAPISAQVADGATEQPTVMLNPQSRIRRVT